jgi:hypothetical protein
MTATATKEGPVSVEDDGMQAVASGQIDRRLLAAPAAGATSHTVVDSTERAVFAIVSAQEQPLTLRRIASLANLPRQEAVLALEAMCKAGILRRLNTVIESYTARFR